MSLQNGVLDIEIEYCAPCGYTPRVISLTQEVLGEREIEYAIRSWRLIPGTNGVFEVTINGERVFSKKELGRHAEEGEVKGLIVAAVEKHKASE